MRHAVPTTLAVVALAVVLVLGYQVFTVTDRLGAIEQRLGAIDQSLGGANQSLAGVEQRLGAVGDDIDDVDERVRALDGRLDDLNERVEEVADVADEALRASEFFLPPWLASPPIAVDPVTGTLGEPFDVSIDPQLAPMTSGRYTVLAAKRLDNDVQVTIRWEATVGPLNVSTFSWRGYDDLGNQYDGVGFTEDEPDMGFPVEGTLAQGRQREANVYLLGAAGAEHLWIELIDFLGGHALAEVQLW